MSFGKLTCSPEESRRRYDAKMKKLIVAYRIMCKFTDRFANRLKLNEFPSDERHFLETIGKDKGFAMSARYQEVKSPMRSLFFLIKALVEENESQINNFYNHIKFDVAKTDRYVEAILKRLESEDKLPG